MKVLFAIGCLLFAGTLVAFDLKPGTIIQKARANLGSEAALNGVVTLQVQGQIVLAGSRMPDAQIKITARKPSSQRLEVRIDDLIEITLLEGRSGHIIRSNVNDAHDRFQMRAMTPEELKRVIFNTRQLFNFYRPDIENNEIVSYEGIVQRRGLRCHKLIYTCYEDIFVTRYFSVDENKLVSVVTEKGVECVEIGEQIVAGIKFPKQVDYYQENALLHSLILDSIHVNQPLPLGIFTLPKVKSR